MLVLLLLLLQLLLWLCSCCRLIIISLWLLLLRLCWLLLSSSLLFISMCGNFSSLCRIYTKSLLNTFFQFFTLFSTRGIILIKAKLSTRRFGLKELIPQADWQAKEVRCILKSKETRVQFRPPGAGC